VKITLPFVSRWLFNPYHERTQRYAVVVAHRRCGKTVACVGDLIEHALQVKPKEGWSPGRYAYVGPYLGQAKEVAWEYLKHFAGPLIADKNEGELWVEVLPHRARIRIHGADNPDRLRGAWKLLYCSGSNTNQANGAAELFCLVPSQPSRCM
jgi:hypothetical protein